MVTVEVAVTGVVTAKLGVRLVVQVVARVSFQIAVRTAAKVVIAAMETPIEPLTATPTARGLEGIREAAGRGDH
jgi:hypothetical protein